MKREGSIFATFLVEHVADVFVASFARYYYIVYVY